MIYPQDDGTFVISSRGGWLPGIYDSERTARYAFRFATATLQQLSDQINHIDRENRAITMDDLRKMPKRKDGEP